MSLVTRVPALLVGLSLALAPLARADEPAWPPAMKTVTARQSAERVRAEKGHPVVLVYWAAWCGDCRQELPDLEALQAELGPKGVRLLPFTIDEAPAPMARLLAARALTLPLVRVTPLEKADLQAAVATLGGHFTGGIPYVAVFDKQGKLVREWTAGKPVAHDELFNTVRSVL